MNKQGENFAQVLDRVLHGRGQGALIELSEALGRDGDLDARQVHGSLKSWRSELRAGLTFDLALRVAVAVPELLRSMAREAGYVLVPQGSVEAAMGGGSVAMAAASIRESGETVSTFLDVVADGVVSAEELARFREDVREDAELKAAMMLVVERLAERRGKGSGEKRATDFTDCTDGERFGAADRAPGDARPGCRGETPHRSTKVCGSESGSERRGNPGAVRAARSSAPGEERDVTGRRDGQSLKDEEQGKGASAEPRDPRKSCRSTAAQGASRPVDAGRDTPRVPSGGSVPCAAVER